MKKEIKTELTKEKILSAAMMEFGTKGYAGGSLNSVCSAGIAKGLLYHNFKNKDALYLACAERCLERLMEHLKKENVCSDVHHYMETRLQFFQENQLEAHLFFEILLQPPAPLKDQLAELRRGLDTLNQSIYKNMLQSIELREGITQEDALQYFILIQNMFNGYFSSPAFCGMPLAEVMSIHEAKLIKLLDYIIYGIATGGKKL